MKKILEKKPLVIEPEGVGLKSFDQEILVLQIRHEDDLKQPLKI